MSLRVKVFLFIIFLNLSTAIFRYYLSYGYSEPKFQALEVKDAENNLRLVKRNLENYLSGMDQIVRDYAYWDDTYQFSQDLNERYIESNLVPSTFQNIGVHYMVFLDDTSNIKFVKGYNLDTGAELGVSQEFREFIKDTAKKIFTEHLNGNGFLVYDSQTYLMVSRPILKSNRDGSSPGTLMMIREFDTALQEKISDITQLDFDIIPYDSIVTTLTRAQIALMFERGYLVETDSKGVSQGYLLVEGIDMSPLLTIKVQQSSELMKLVHDSNARANLIQLVTLLYSLTLGMLFLEVSSVRPLRFLIREIDKMRTRKFSSQRLQINASSEFKELTKNINTMLETLDTFDKKVVEVNQQLEAKAQELQDNSSEMERLNRHMVGRELRMAELKEEIEELKYKLSQKHDDVQ